MVKRCFISLVGALMVVAVGRADSDHSLSLAKIEKLHLGQGSYEIANAIGEPDAKIPVSRIGKEAWLYYADGPYKGVARLVLHFDQGSKTLAAITMNLGPGDPERFPEAAKKHFPNARFLEKKRFVRNGPDAFGWDYYLEDEKGSLALALSADRREVSSIVWESPGDLKQEDSASKDGTPVVITLSPDEERKLREAAARRLVGSTGNE